MLFDRLILIWQWLNSAVLVVVGVPANGAKFIDGVQGK